MFFKISIALELIIIVYIPAAGAGLPKLNPDEVVVAAVLPKAGAADPPPKAGAAAPPPKAGAAAPPPKAGVDDPKAGAAVPKAGAAAVVVGADPPKENPVVLGAVPPKL